MHVEVQPQSHAVEALLRAGLRLLEGSSASPRLDAEILLAFALGRSRTWLFTHRTAAAPGAHAGTYLALIRERQAGRPVAQLTGRREFWSLPLAVNRDVLAPRPDTELLVEQALARIPGSARWRVLDLGTGSGAVALAIAAERPGCEVVATDLSRAALDVARRNAGGLNFRNVSFREGDWLAAIPGEVFDLIVSNPPYIADGEWPTTDRELQFEPRLALAGGPDGLDAIRVIVTGAAAHLAPGAALLIEHSLHQGDAVQDLFRAHGYQEVATYRDLAGMPRVTAGRRAR